MRFKPRLDIRSMAANVVDIQQNCRDRNMMGAAESVPQVASLYAEWVTHSRHMNELRSRRNKLSDQVRSPDVMREAGRIKKELHGMQETSRSMESHLHALAAKIPNDIHPAPRSITKPSLMHTIGTPREPSLDHLDICDRLHLLDLPAAAEVSGYGWYYLKNALVLLEQALVSHSLDIASKRGWEMVSAPSVVRSGLVAACGYQPRDEIGQQVYHLESDKEDAEERLSLAGTAEIPLAGLGLNRIFTPDELPKRIVGVGRSYRAEAGSRGAASRGLFRVHEFCKVELFAFTAPHDSEGMLNEIRLLQQEMVEVLGLCARVLDMPPNDLGASAYRKHDIEAWMPGRQKWGEITSCSNCTDYQSRRLHARHKSADGQMGFVHTVNGTAAAIPRLLIALLETGWDGEGVRLPQALEPYMRTSYIR